MHKYRDTPEDKSFTNEHNDEEVDNDLENRNDVKDETDSEESEEMQKGIL